MRNFREIYRRSIDTIKKYAMITSADGIMVGLSGGKDSLVLLKVLAEFLRHSKYKYPLAAGHIDLGLGADYSPLADFCRDLGVDFYLEKTAIGPIIFDVRQEKNPCSLCAKMRRGALNQLAKDNGFNKVALGHHQDDYVETFLLSTFFEGRIDSFKPVTYLDRMDITVLRPMLTVPESLIAKHAHNFQLPIVKNPCAIDGLTKRQDMKNILAELEKINPNAKELACRALERNYLEKSGQQLR